jgi:hypothetical protein
LNAISVKESGNYDSESPINWSSSKSSRKKDHKVLIIGDSHTRNCAANIKTNIEENFKVQGVIPGAGTSILVNSLKNDIRSLSKSDVLIFCGGANDTGKNISSKALHNFMDFVINNKHTNIILVTVPHRYDLMQSSCVKSEIKSFNRKLKKMVKVHHHASVLEIDNHRKLFTNHGLHLNGQGKEVLSKLIVSHTYSILEQKIDPPVILNWKSEHNLTVPLNHINAVSRTSARQRKTPSMKSDDFIMVNRDSSVGDNSLINGSIKVMRSLKTQKDNLECKKQGPKSLRFQLSVSNNPLPDSNKSKNLMVSHHNVRGLLNKSEE